MIKTLRQLQIEEDLLKLLNSIYKNPRTNILNCERLNAFSLKSGTRQGCLLSALLFNIVLEIPTIAERQEKGRKGI